MMGNVKKRFAVNKMKQKFDEERRVRSILKNKEAVDCFRSTGKNYFPKRFISENINTDKNFIVNANSNFAKNKNSSDNIILNSRNEDNSDHNFDSPPPNINLNKIPPVTSNKFYSMSDVKKNISGYNSNNNNNIKVIQKTLSSTINAFNKNNKTGKQVFDAVQLIQRNKTGNQFLKSNSNNFYETNNSNRKILDSVNNVNFDMEDYFNLMNLNPNYPNEEKSANDFNILNKYLGNNVKESPYSKTQKDLNNKSQQSFYESPIRRNQFYNVNEMRNLDILKKLAFKEETKKIIYETEDTEY